MLEEDIPLMRNQQVLSARGFAFPAWQWSSFNLKISQESFPRDPYTLAYTRQ